MIRPSSAAAAMVLLGAAGLWLSAGFVERSNPTQLQLCAAIPAEAPEFMRVELEASNPHKLLTESFSEPGTACAAVVDVDAEQYTVSVAMLKSKCWPLGVDSWIDCDAPTLSHFEVQREDGGVQRMDAVDAWATVTPSVAGYARVTAVFTTGGTPKSGQEVGRLLRDDLFAQEPIVGS